MNREEADQALQIVRKVIENTRDDLVAHNWGLIWMIHAFTNGAGFVSIGLFVEPQGLPIYWYFVPLGGLSALNFIILLTLMKRDQGVRSFVEFQLHGIWTGFVLFSIAGALTLFLADAGPALFCPIISMCTGIGFSMMGLTFRREFLGYAVLFMAVLIVSPVLPELQWYLLGGAWWISLFIPGLRMHREKRAREREGGGATLL